MAKAQAWELGPGTLFCHNQRNPGALEISEPPFSFLSKEN